MSPRIKVLEPAVIDRIAAGEVVERPASVVKELVENALDAGARRLAIRIEGAGTRLVEVSDDGSGMGFEDAELAFVQHATSKIRSPEDLDKITSLGFRGEALASIAAVSKVEMITCSDASVGTRVRVAGGEILQAEPKARSRGTAVRVEELFFNTPARHKHLRTAATEFSHIASVVQDFALLRPDVHWSLSHGSREVLLAPAVASLRERVHQVFGHQVSRHWIVVESARGSIRVSGGLTAPDHSRPNRRQLRLFVNGRAVADGRLAHAVSSAFGTLLSAGRHPVAALFLELPAENVDVNVHPRKAEVRFLDPGRIYGALRGAVQLALASNVPPRPIHARSLQTPDPAGDASSWDRTAKTAEQTLWRRSDSTLHPAHATLPVREWRVMEGAGVVGETAERRGAESERHGGWQGAEVRPDAVAGTSGAIQALTQYGNTYIVAADAAGLLIIDQHVAHEQILYEQVLDQLGQQAIEVQRLLVPETMELTVEEATVAQEHATLLSSMGFELEPFGGTTWAIQSAPAMLAERRISTTVRSLLASLSEQRGPEVVQEAERQVAASIACHAAVRANQPLSREVMASLVEQLGRCKAPARCPHGRPVMLRVDMSAIERRLGRR